MHSATCPSTQKRFVWRYFWLILTVTIKDRTYCWTVGHSKFLKRHVERQTRGLKEWKYEKLSEYVITMIPCVRVTLCARKERARESETKKLFEVIVGSCKKESRVGDKKEEKMIFYLSSYKKQKYWRCKYCDGIMKLFGHKIKTNHMNQ